MHPHTIFVTSLFEMPRYVRELSPSRVVSIIQPELQPQRPETLAPGAHLRVAVHDISEALEDHVLADHEHVVRLVEFLERWNPDDGALLTHCYAGVSRSTAAALVAAVLKTRDPDWSARQLRAAAPHALPNRHIVSLADDVLGLGGALVEARASMSEASVIPDEAPITVLRIDAEQRR